MKMTVLCAGLSAPHAGWTAIDELAVLAADCFDATLLSSPAVRAPWPRRALGGARPRFAPIESAGGDVLFVVARGPEDLALAGTIADVRRKFGRIHAFVTDSYFHAGYARETSLYDSITVTAHEDVDHPRERFGIEVHQLYQGIDALIVDETGFLKKGDKSVGVQRQYSGTAGRIENCQIGVFLALSTLRGRALVDRALYLPESWCSDASRCQEAGVPEDAAFATKPQLAMKMLDRALEAGLQPEFVLADEVYGNDSKFRRFLENRGRPFVVAVKCGQYLWAGFQQRRMDDIAAEVPVNAWTRMSVGDGAKGPRVYDWAAARYGAPTEKGLIRWLLIRRNIETQERAYYLCTAPKRTTARDLAIAAGRRWAIEVCFETAKQETGLDEYEVRSWDGWHRHITLSMLAMAFLTVVRSTAASRTQSRSKSAATSFRSRNQKSGDS